MRNLIKYPISEKELLSCLRSVSTSASHEQAPGDMRPILLECARDIIAAAPDSIKRRIMHDYSTGAAAAKINNN